MEDEERHVGYVPPDPAEDEPLLVKFHQTLSPESVYRRYFSQLKLDQRIAHERLRICANDYDRRWRWWSS